VLERVGSGRYGIVNPNVTEQHELVVASTAVPSGVICLLSALRFHNIGTQLPHQVWISVRRGARVPRLSFPLLRTVRVSPAMFELGIETHRLEGHPVRVYSLARTVADCFRFRNTIGLDVALEALKEAWRSRRLKMDELNRVAKQLRVNRVMQPYLETTSSRPSRLGSFSTAEHSASTTSSRSFDSPANACSIASRRPNTPASSS
jgi:predicted transcriptional regulator of viral defense system